MTDREIIPTDAQIAERDLPTLLQSLKKLQAAMEQAKDELLKWKGEEVVWYEDIYGSCPAQVVYYACGMDDDVTVPEPDAPVFDFLYNLILSIENSG